MIRNIKKEVISAVRNCVAKMNTETAAQKGIHEEEQLQNKAIERKNEKEQENKVEIKHSTALI